MRLVTQNKGVSLKETGVLHFLLKEHSLVMKLRLWIQTDTFEFYYSFEFYKLELIYYRYVTSEQDI